MEDPFIVRKEGKSIALKDFGKLNFESWNLCHLLRLGPNLRMIVFSLGGEHSFKEC